MTIDFDAETIEITSKLKQVDGYLDCEKIIVHNIQKQLQNGNNDENIVLYLKKLSTWFETKIAANQTNADCTNYRYASGFVDTLLKMPYWKSWMKTIDM
jgi:hypothetical protein